MRYSSLRAHAWESISKPVTFCHHSKKPGSEKARIHDEERNVSEWTRDKVAARCAEAVSTGRRLPPVRVQGYFNVWPKLVRQSWERLSADDRPVLRFPPEPAAIDRMIETMGWIACLNVEQRLLVWMRAEERAWREICARLGCDRTTAWRRWQAALQVIVDHLTASSCQMLPKIPP